MRLVVFGMTRFCGTGDPSPISRKNPRFQNGTGDKIFYLLGVFDSLGLSQDVNLDLTGVGELLLDLLGDIPGQQDHLVLANLFGLDHDADLAACLNGVGALDAGEGLGNLFNINFRKKLFASGILLETEETEKHVNHKPARLCRQFRENPQRFCQRTAQTPRRSHLQAPEGSFRS